MILGFNRGTAPKEMGFSQCQASFVPIVCQLYYLILLVPIPRPLLDSHDGQTKSVSPYDQHPWPERRSERFF